MASASGFSLFTQVVLIVVAVFAVIAVLLVIAAAVLRSRNDNARSHDEALRAHWQKLFRTVFTTPATELPIVEKDDLYTVLIVFTNVRELRQSDRESATDYGGMLNDMAHKIGLDEFAQRLLRRGDRADRIVALNALGQLGDRSALATARELLEDPGTELSRAAAHCMLRLEPGSIDQVIVQIRDRKDWVRPRVEAMLRELGTARVDPAMREAIRTSSNEGRESLLDLANCCSPAVAREISLQVIDDARDPGSIAAALRSLAPQAQHSDAPIARRYAVHDQTFVRLAALRVLKTVADRSDLDVLGKLVTDRDWWVRHRAAEVLVELSGGNSDAASLAGEHADPYARAAVSQAIAAYKLGILGERLDDRRETGGRGPEARS